MFKPSKDESELDEIIEMLLEDVRDPTHLSDEEKSKVFDQLGQFYKLKESQTRERVSSDTLAIIAGNLLGIALIINQERLHVVNSKALSFVLRLR